MYDWIYDYLKEMVERLEIKITDDISDILTEYSNGIADGVSEGYYCSGNYIADCNIRGSEKSKVINEVELLKQELNALYDAIKIKGFNFHFNNNCVYETGMEHIGGTVCASYDRLVKS